jgi:hypothetical protein
MCLILWPFLSNAEWEYFGGGSQIPEDILSRKWESCGEKIWEWRNKKAVMLVHPKKNSINMKEIHDIS